MPLTVVARRETIVDAINSFKATYHDDYYLVNGLARQYLVDPIEEKAALLADALAGALVNWGAGSRRAPNVRPVSELKKALLALPFHKSLLEFSGGALATMTIIGGRTRMIGGAVGHLVFDASLLAVLSHISTRLLIGNTNVTYPMKALLLLTGFMPALDSQVRRGLSSAGFPGTSATRFRMPEDNGSLEARKLTRLPFYLGECFATNKALLTSAAIESNYPWLADEPGRLLDVLMFMQGSMAAPLFAFTPRVPRWHALP